MAGYRLESKQGPSWWELDEGDDVGAAVWSAVDRIRMQSFSTRDRMLRLMRMYGGYALPQLGLTLDPGRLRYNLAAQCVDTLLAEVATQIPKVTYLADGGDWRLKQACKLREALIEAQMRDTRFHGEVARECVRDAMVANIGICRVRTECDELELERVFPLEVLVDELDGRHGKPRRIYVVQPVPREVALRRWGKGKDNEQAIKDAAKATRIGQVEQQLYVSDTESDEIWIAEAWSLPSGHDAGDGRHVVAIEGATLVDEEYKRSRFPLAFCRTKPAPLGFYGVGVVEEVQPDQIELNRVCMKVQDTLAAAAGFWSVPKNSGLSQKNITDVPGVVLEHNQGMAPQFVAPVTLAPDLLQQYDAIISRCLRRMGISEMLATASKPAGLNSGEAIRTHSDIHTKRQAPRAQAVEQFVLDVAQIMSDANEDLASRPEAKNAETRAMVRRGRRTLLRRIRWGETKLPENKFLARAYPMNALPSEPSGRLATLTEWVQGGLITQDEARAMMDFPDVEGANALHLSDHDLVLYAYEVMTEDGEYVSPEPFQDLTKALELMRRAYCRAVIDEVPEDRLELIRNYLEDAKGLMAPAPAPAAAPAAPPVDPSLAAPELSAPPGAAAGPMAA